VQRAVHVEATAATQRRAVARQLHA
jgi:hypothetical protein